MKKIRVICFIIIFIFLFSKIDRVFSYKMPYGVPQFEAFYEQEKGSVDVLFVGTSHVYSDINPAYLYEENGICSYNLATASASIRDSYFAIQQALEYQEPKVIILELFGVRYNIEEYRTRDRETMDANFGLRNQILKIKSLAVSAPEEKRLEYFLEFPFYHSSYASITKRDFKPYNNVKALDRYRSVFLYDVLKNYKGALALPQTYQNGDINIADISNVNDIVEISAKNEEYLKKIIGLADSKNINLCFLVSPLAITEEQQKNFNYIKSEIAEPHNIEFLNSQLYFDEMGIDINSDFADADGHLNYKGMEKFSRWLSKRVADMNSIEDKRGTKEAESWDKNLAWEKEVSKAFGLCETTDFKTYISKLNGLDCTAYLTFTGNTDTYIAELSNILNKQIPWNETGSLILKNNCVETLNREEVRIDELEDDTIAIKQAATEDFVENVIVYNAAEQRKVTLGINIVVYDDYIGEVVDVVGFDANNNMAAVR